MTTDRDPGRPSRHAHDGGQLARSRRRTSSSSSARASWPLGPTRLIVGAVVVCLLLLVGWRIVVETNARSLAATDPEAALEWRSNSAAALTVLAEQRLSTAQSKDDYAAGIALAESALLANPLQERAIALIALGHNASGQATGVEPLMQRAASRSRRDLPVQGWLFNDALRRGDYVGALDHANAILMTGINLRGAVLTNLQSFMATPEARAALLARLTLGPSWRSEFLSGLSWSKAPADVVFALLSDLALGANPPSNAELGPLLQRLVRDGQFDLAYVMWIHFLPKEQRGLVKYAFNGDFELPPTALPFDWLFPANPGAATAIVETGDAGRGHVLHVEFANTRANNLVAIKVLTLTPGSYRLTGSVKAADLQNERGVVWRIACAGKNGATLVTTAPLKGTVPWQDFSLDFQVPPQDCRGQSLGLEIPARAELERQISGEAWFDNLTVERLQAGSAGNT